jgi:hypothetical protein
MAVKSMEMAVESMESMEMAPGAIPRPDKVLEQRLLSSEIGLRRRRHCGTLSRKTPIDLGFLRRRDYIGGRAMSGGGLGGHTTWWRGQRERATLWCACLLPPFVSPLDSVSCRGK